jgi:hypothetical protein
VDHARLRIVLENKKRFHTAWTHNGPRAGSFKVEHFLEQKVDEFDLCNQALALSRRSAVIQRSVERGIIFSNGIRITRPNGFAALAKVEASDTRELVDLRTGSDDFACHSWSHRNGRLETAPSY